MNKSVDYLIVGQGLAGTFLAFNLFLKRKSFCVVDKGHSFSSSFIAAGIINPLVLKRLTKTWRAEEFLAYNEGFYKSIEELLQQDYLFQIPIEKLISSAEEEIFWQHRYEKEEIKNFIHPKLTEVDENILPTTNFKVGNVKHTSWLNISRLLTDFRNYLSINNQLITECFNHSKLTKNTYKDLTFKHLIFCEGAQAESNPLFENLPFSLNKGQLMTINSSVLPKNKILKKKVFILPVKDNEFKVGATFSWKWDTSTFKSAHEKEEEKTLLLKQQLEEITASEYTVIKEETGIRPAVKDRRPLIGKHKDYDNIYLFNGMGSKGCFMAPLLSNELVQYIEEGKSLPPEVRLNRYD